MSILDRFRVDGARALVTGAGRGIGRASALALAEAGADVALVSRTEGDLDAVATEISALGRRALVLPFDVMDLEGVPALIERVGSELGGLEILVNNAGGSFPKPLLETSARSFEKAFTFNVTTALEMTKAATPLILRGGGGSIVNISSAAGRMADRGFAAYGTAKAAMNHLSRINAMDLAPHIRVNAIAVGSVATDALATVLDAQRRSAMEANTPLRRLGTPEDIAAAVLYLCSPAGAYVTGKVLEVDGGIDHPTLALGLPDYSPDS
ncbi:MAG: glucose 1-dehydrogenase [Microthrixaceae bacterium]